MVQRIQAPNGDILEFPDDMPEDAMLSVMQREYGGPAAPAAPASAPLGGDRAQAAMAPTPATAVAAPPAGQPVAPAAPVDNNDIARANEAIQLGKANLNGVPGMNPMQASIEDAASKQRAQEKDVRDAGRVRSRPAIEAEWNNMNPLQKIFTASGDIVHNAQDAATMGFGNRAIAGVTSAVKGVPFDQELASLRKRTDEGAERAGWAGTAAKVAGALAGPASKVIGPAETAVSGIGNWGMRQLARGGIGAATGAAYGGVDAAGHSQDVEQGAKSGALFGGLTSLAAPAISNAAGKVIGAFTDVKNAVPTLDSLRGLKDRAYSAVENSGVTYPRTQVNRAVRRAASDAASADIHPQLHRQATAKLGQIQEQAAALNPRPAANGQPSRRGSDMSLKQADQMVQNINRDLNANDAESFMAGVLRRPIDSLIGSNSQGSQLVSGAREANRRFKVVEDVDNRLYRSENATAPPRNAVPAAMRGALSDPKGLLPAEQRAMEQAVRGTRTGNVAREISNRIPGGLVSSGVAGSSTAYMTGNPVLGGLVALGLPVVKGVAGKVADREATKAVENVIRTVTNTPARVKSQARRAVEGPLSQELIKKLLFLGQQESQ